MPEFPSPRAIALGVRLRELRDRRFRSGAALALALDWSQSKVSRLERGAQLPGESDLRNWVRITDADEETLAELQEMLAAARTEHRRYRDAWAVAGEIAAIQNEFAELDMRSSRIVEFQPSFVPGLLQTPAYARAVMSAPASVKLLGATAEGIEDRLRALDRRQSRVLYAPDKRIQIAIGEAALRTRFGSEQTMAGQRDRLVAVAGLSTVELGVLPFSRPCPVLPLSGFVINDDAHVWLETLSDERRLDDPAEVAIYVQAFDLLWDVAVRGDDAIRLIRAVT